MPGADTRQNPSLTSGHVVLPSGTQELEKTQEKTVRRTRYRVFRFHTYNSRDSGARVATARVHMFRLWFLCRVTRVQQARVCAVARGQKNISPQRLKRRGMIVTDHGFDQNRRVDTLRRRNRI